MISRIKLLWHLISFPFPCYLGMFPLLFLINLPDSPFLFPNICCKNQIFFSAAKIRFYFCCKNQIFFFCCKNRIFQSSPFPVRSEPPLSRCNPWSSSLGSHPASEGGAGGAGRSCWPRIQEWDRNPGWKSRSHPKGSAGGWRNRLLKAAGRQENK